MRQVLSASRGEALEPCDLILVLGRRLDGDHPTDVFLGRLAHAAALWRGGLAPRVLVAGGLTARATRSEAEAGRAWLVADGLPNDAVFVEDQSQHTLENIFHVRATMRSKGWRTMILVSDGLHLARAGAMARGLGLEFRRSAVSETPLTRHTITWVSELVLETFLLHWYHTGVGYSRLTGSRRQLERVS